MTPDKTSNRTTDLSLRNSAIIAGIGLIIIAILAPIADFSILNRLVAEGNPALTTGNIVASEGLFRIAVCFFLIVAVLDLVVAWALYVFLKPVNRSISLLTAWLRMVYASMLLFAIIYLLNVLQLLNGADYLSSFTTNQLQTQVMLSLNRFRIGWQSGLIIFGFHLFLLGYLVLKAGYMRRILGILIIIASTGYLIDGFGSLLASDYKINMALYTFIGEVVLIFWLFIKGWRIKHTS